MKLTPHLVDAMRRSSLRDEVYDYLLTIDKDRFRRLGQQKTIDVVELAIQYGDSAELEFVENYKYLVFMMYFVGSYFHEDHRYNSIHRWLHYKVTTSNDRVSQAHLVFKSVADRFIGSDFRLMKVALRNFSDQISSQTSKEISEECIFEYFCDSYKLNSEERLFLNFSIFQNNARSNAHKLGIDNSLGRATCLTLALWLGSGFFKDPMFPWVVDISQRTYSNSFDRSQAVFEYAQKRVVRLLKVEAPPCV